eukprot:tig00000254_g22533.t1
MTFGAARQFDTSAAFRIRILSSHLSTSAAAASTSQKRTGMAASFDYDFAVIGGGSGGMAAAKEAAKLGANVVCFDYVKPSPQGTRWGLGGTCVNVGCVPKKLMHYAGILGAGMHDAHELGLKVPVGEDGHSHVKHDWGQLVGTVQNHVHSLNFSYRVGLRSAKVNYVNALAKFADPHTIAYTEKGVDKTLTAKYILIAVGGRPQIPDDVPGAREYAITSDDVFSMTNEPGRVLCVGGSYISLECAGFFTELGYDTSVAVRSIFLRGFDQQCADKVASVMADLGTKFLRGIIPSAIQKREDGRLEVSFKKAEGGEAVPSQVFDTVLFATGRTPDVKGLNLDAAGVKTLKSGKIPVEDERTNVEHIFAVGDVIPTRQELTPVAIKAGEMLARRLFAGSTQVLDYHLVPTAVFTPVEYGCVGYSEEEAERLYGKQNVETYLSEFMTLEFGATHRKKAKSAIVDELDDAMQPMCLAKLVCLKENGVERVIGFHFVGPNAGEVTQGFALALKLGATKKDFDNLVGIHPTDAEVFCALSITRSSGEDFRASGGCGGGKCG